MQTDQNRPSLLSDIDESTLGSIVKLLLVGGALFVLWGPSPTSPASMR